MMYTGTVAWSIPTPAPGQKKIGRGGEISPEFEQREDASTNSPAKSFAISQAHHAAANVSAKILYISKGK